MGLFPYNKDFGQIIKTDVSKGSTDRGFIAHLTLSSVLAEDNDRILVSTPLAELTTTEVTVFNAQPDVTRNVTITGNQASVTGDVVIVGTNINDEVITETIASNGVSEVVGNKAFKTITQITLPVYGALGDEIAVGIGSKLGLAYKLPHNTVLHAHLNDVRESSFTVVTSASTLESNTITLNSALDGNDVDIYLVV